VGLALMNQESRRRELDELTLRRAQRGEPAALEAFVVTHQRAVFALLSRMLGRAHRVEDLAQETFLRAFRALPAFRSQEAGGTARLSTWVLTIATHLALDELRARKLEPLPPALPDPRRADETAERKAIARRIEAALDELGPQFRAAFVLRELHELDYEEIAEALACDVGTVKSRLARARERLRDLLEDLQ
jgi:RNA polymerase sigma-70 factor (ECF subfamily)